MGHVRFRDGKKFVPDYLEEQMTGLDTKAMTRDEAVAAVNRKLEGDFVRHAQETMIRNHFRGLRS